MVAAQRQPDRGANPKPRERAWRPKSTNGCFTCKRRRVKCDEGKPNCKRCSSTGRHCDGYGPPPQSSTSPSTSPTSTSPVSPADMLSGQFATKEEGEGFDFFLNFAIKDISGVFDSPFWQRELLQATHHHPAIRHGVIAVGTMHRRYTSCQGDSTDNLFLDRQLQFALEQSNRAIQELMKSTKAAPPSESNLKTIMTCCILFSTLACLQGEQHEALNHIRYGLKLMKELITMVFSMPNPMSTWYCHPVTLKSLRRTFLGLNVQALSILGSASLTHWEKIPAHFLENCQSIAIHWVSLECAQHYWESLLSNTLAFAQGAMDMTDVNGLGDAEGLGTWDNSTPELVIAHLQERFQTGISRLHRHFPEVFRETADPNAIIIRLICAQVELFLMVLTSTEDGARNPDDEEPFEALMDLVTRLEDSLVEYRETDVGRVQRPRFTATYGSLSTLFMVATRAPSLRLRKKAITVLLNSSRRDGLWDGPWAGRIAQEAVTLEETSTREALGVGMGHEHIPSPFRIRDIQISYPVPRQTRVEFRSEGAIARGEAGWVRYWTR